MKNYSVCTNFVSVLKIRNFLRFPIICLFCFISVNVVIADISNDLIAYWNFNESQGSSVYDSSGLGNTGSIMGATRVNGISGNALDFDGINDYVVVADKPSQQITTDQLSISLWFNLQQDVGNAQKRLICKQEYDNTGNAWGLEFFGEGLYGSPGNQLVFHDSTGTAAYNCYSGALVETDKWYHVVVVDNAGQISFYLNGGLVHSSNQGYGIPSNIPAEIMIGRTCYNPWGATMYFDGLIDEVRLYNRPLNTGEIQELYLTPEPATIFLASIGFLLSRKR